MNERNCGCSSGAMENAILAIFQKLNAMGRGSRADNKVTDR